uniref:Phospholipase A2 n=1 Tax=Pelusios castaneus TaxID=367368 RepID=A0A8C8SWI1_9SAUR
ICFSLTHFYPTFQKCLGQSRDGTIPPVSKCHRRGGSKGHEASLHTQQLKDITDVLSHSDCYVSLWLPTATCEKIKTKTVNDCKNPVWNETFYFRIQSQIKNVLEMAVYDEDVVSQDDHLFSVYFDVAKLPLGEKNLCFLIYGHVCIIFQADNNEVLCVLCLFPSGKDLSLTVKGSYEGTQDLRLGPDAIISPSYPTKFHYVKYMEPTLNVTNVLGTLICNKCAYVYPSHCSCPQDLDVRFGYDLCAAEKDFLCKRKKYVAAALKNVLQLEEDLQDHEVLVAIMTTGGGMRSLTTAYGSLLGLKKLNVLDCATYLSGLSGTTWTMANLYKDAYWSQKDLDEHIHEAQKCATKCKMGCFSMDRMNYFNKQLCQRKQSGYRTSFIDLWGLIIEYMLHDGKDNHKLSDQREAVNEGQNPLPIYVTVLNVFFVALFAEWVEFTPYEVGFLKYGAFVRAEDLGSEFFMGRLLRRLPETRLCYLQGLWSSVFSLNLLYIWGLSHSSEDFWYRWTRDRVNDIEEEPMLPARPHEVHTHIFTPAAPFSRALREVLTDRLSVAQYHNFLKGFQLHNDYLGNENFCRWKDTVLDSSPNQLSQQQDLLGMVDAGFFINTSCPPLLRPERKVDVILHLSYSAGSQTLPLDQACKYYEEQKIPFPKVFLSEEDRKNLKECYLFQDSETSGSPIVVFFPLVNDTFQHYKAPGVARCCSEMEGGKVDVSSILSPYNTYAVRYTDENYHRLLNLSEYNILNNAHLILQALRMAVERKRCP